MRHASWGLGLAFVLLGLAAQGQFTGPASLDPPFPCVAVRVRVPQRERVAAQPNLDRIPERRDAHHDDRRSGQEAHLERVVRRFTSARATGTLGAEFDALIDRMAAELDASRAKAGGVRGEARQALLDRLAGLDAELLRQARRVLDEDARTTLAREADAELAPFRAGMTSEAFARAREAAIDRHVRRRFGLPTVSFA